MASITIRNVDENVKIRLRKMAAAHGNSMQEELRLILTSATAQEAAQTRGLGTALNEAFKAVGGVDLDLPPREPMRKLPDFK